LVSSGVVLTRRIFAPLEDDPQAVVNEIRASKARMALNNRERRSMGRHSWAKNILVNADWMRAVNKQVAAAV
jgi:hypothetical protein